MDNRMCSKCHKRIAMVFMTKIENGESDCIDEYTKLHETFEGLGGYYYEKE